jgi:hypothetical protein
VRIVAPVLRRGRRRGERRAGTARRHGARREASLLARLAVFLHPLTGGPDGRGWGFGQLLHISQVALLLESTEVSTTRMEIVMRVGDELFSDLVPVGSRRAHRCRRS